MRINRRVCGLTAAACLAITATSCGDSDGGEEAVFLYFLNGYPGTGAMSVRSDTGIVANKVPFGERYGEDGSCGPDAENCLPVRIERQRSPNFTYILENMAQPAEIQKQLFSMYPHETGTVVLTRRSGESSVNTTLLRHTQSISSDCTITYVNGMSVDNQYLGVATFSISPEFYEENIAIARFGNEGQSQFTSECGTLPASGETYSNLQRPELLARIRDNPWFLPVCGEDIEEEGPYGDCILRWGIPYEDGRVRINEGGAFLSVLDSQEYFECIQGAISIRQPEDDMGNTIGFPNPEPDCPNEDGEDVAWEDVDVDFNAVGECQKPIVRTVEMVIPGQDDTALSYQGNAICESEFRIRNEGMDIVFGPAGNDDLGSHGDGAPVQTTVDIPNGSQRFFLMIGRPVNPLVWQWDSSETFVDLEFYPYFNEGGDRPEIGEYDYD